MEEVLLCLLVSRHTRHFVATCSASSVSTYWSNISWTPVAGVIMGQLVTQDESEWVIIDIMTHRHRSRSEMFPKFIASFIFICKTFIIIYHRIYLLLYVYTYIYIYIYLVMSIYIHAPL